MIAKDALYANMITISLGYLRTIHLIIEGCIYAGQRDSSQDYD